MLTVIFRENDPIITASRIQNSVLVGILTKFEWAMAWRLHLYQTSLKQLVLSMNQILEARRKG